MYTMWTGATASGSGLVWHVVGRDQEAALCGQRVRPPEPDGQDRTDRHCLACMTAFQEVMRTAPVSG